jgi:KipI family sensor histidine kinase inhibitor
VRTLPYGAAALLVEVDDPGDVIAVAAGLRRQPGVEEVVPAARTVLVSGDPVALARAVATVDAEDRPRADTAPSGGEPVVLDVDYAGADLARTARDLGLAEDDLVQRHAGGSYVVAFCGFVPGFAYLTGLDPELHAPRLAQPRTRVPAGSVGIAGEFTGVYPRESPGGWRLIGRTDAELWNPERSSPALLPPGTPVRFRPR